MRRAYEDASYYASMDGFNSVRAKKARVGNKEYFLVVKRGIGALQDQYRVTDVYSKSKKLFSVSTDFDVSRPGDPGFGGPGSYLPY